MKAQTIGMLIRVLVTLISIVFASFETGMVTGFCLFMIFIFIEVQTKRNEDVRKTLKMLIK